MTLARLTAVLTALVLTLAGCGLDDPYTNPDADTTTPTQPARDAQGPPDTLTGATTTVPDTIRDRDEATRVAVDYAITQATWTPDTWISQQQRLRDLSTGQARDELDRGTPLDEQAQAIADARSTSRATFLAADYERGRPPTSERATVVVVLRVVAGGEGRQDTYPEHTINRAKLTRTPAGWRVSSYVTLP